MNLIYIRELSCCWLHDIGAKPLIRVGRGQTKVWRRKLAQTAGNFSGRQNSMQKGQKVKKKKDGKNLSVIGLCISDHYYTFIFINIE